MTYNSYQLQEVCSFIDYRGKTPPKTTEGIPLITAKIIKNGTILAPQEFIAADYYDDWMRRGIPKKGSIVFTTEAPLGEVAQIKTVERIAFAQRVIVMEPNPDILNANYLLYALQDQVLKERIKARATGTTVIGIKAAELKKVTIDLPPLDVQKDISDILRSFDDKIELNQKINKNLERQTQAIFESWFTGKREINGCLADICQYSKEKVAVSSLDLESYYSTENMLPGKAGATQAASLPTTTQTTKCNVGDVLVSNIRPYFKKIVYCHADCGCSTDVLCFAPKKQELSAYLFFLLYADSFFDFMVAGSKGTKMPRGDKQQIMMYPVYVPSDEELMAFNRVAQPVMKQVQFNREENKRLIALRDTLLPKLMTGEIDIKDVNL